MRSALIPERQALGLPMLASLAGHGAGALLLIGFAAFSMDTRPIVDPEKAMEVSMVVLPKSKTSVPHPPTKAPIPRGDIPTAEAPPAPIRESDLVVHEPDAPKSEAKGAPDRNTSREELLRKLAMEEMLAAAPDGMIDRMATDPNSTTDQGINAIGPGTLGDPEFARYQQQLQQLFMKNFNVLPTTTSDLVCVMTVEVDATTGKVKGYSVKSSSGNLSYDAAAERAVQAVSTVPLPPERFVPLLARGFDIRFVPPRR